MHRNGQHGHGTEQELKCVMCRSVNVSLVLRTHIICPPRRCTSIIHHHLRVQIKPTVPVAIFRGAALLRIMLATMPRSDKVIDNSEYQRLAESARNSLRSVEDEIRDSLENTYFERMQACLSDAWAQSGGLKGKDKLPSATTGSSTQFLARVHRTQNFTDGKKDLPNAVGRAKRSGKKEKTIISCFSSTKSKDKTTFNFAHFSEPLDSRPVTQFMIPSSISRTPIISCFQASDNTELSFVPGQMDPDSKDLQVAKEGDIEEYLQLFDTKKRIREMEIGPSHQRSKADDLAKLALKHLQQWQALEGEKLGKDGWVTTISSVFPELDQRCLERKVALFWENPDSVDENVFASPESLVSPEPVGKGAGLTEKTIVTARCTSDVVTPEKSNGHKSIFPSDRHPHSKLGRCVEIVHGTLTGDDKEYLDAIDTPRNLYCPRCKLYCCNLHLEAGFDRASLQLQYESAIDAERRRAGPVQIGRASCRER